MMNSIVNSYRKRKHGVDPLLRAVSPPLIYDARLHEPWQRIFAYLSVRDLSALACCTRKFYYDVEAYCETLCKRLSLTTRLQEFFSSNLVLRKDTQVVDEIEGASYKHYWLYITWKRLRRLRRASISKFNMDNLGNPEYIIRKWDSHLKREIVMFRSVVWLQVTYRFRSVLPGTYRVVLRMSNYDAPVKIRIYWEDINGYDERTTIVKSYEWRTLRNVLKRLRVDSSIRLESDASVSNYDPKHGWFDFNVADFSVMTSCDVIFEYSDILDDWWKAGMRCDFVELRPLEWIDD